jgi:trk system potassium uptake protein
VFRLLHRLSPLQLLTFSFLVLIGLGTLLLKLPPATPDDQPITWLDALFTATSAVCVTGLVVRDTGSGFTGFGQGVIFALFQLGGLGVMTLSLFIFSLLRRRLPIAYRILIEDLAGSARSDMVALLRLVLLFLLITEGVGAVLLWLCWWPELGAAGAVWPSVFHSVSAFCNAGFSLWPDSLTTWRGHLGVMSTMSALIVLGGLGFIVVYELSERWRLRHLRPPPRWSVHTRLVVVTSAVLIVLGTVFFHHVEGPRILATLSPEEGWLVSLFQSITTRTAGFNSVDIGVLSPATLMGMMLLMFVGGSPGSTAGGVKTTTLAVLVVSAWSRLRGRTRVSVAYRQLTDQTVRGAMTVATGAVAAFTLGLLLLILAEAPQTGEVAEEALFLRRAFEAASALGTVGLSTGVTGNLTPHGRLVVIALMFLGRLGPLTVASALTDPEPRDDWHYPEEEVMVG